MEISFTTKEESNQRREEAFLKLKPVERFYSFLNLMVSVNQFPTKNNENKNKDNFVIVINQKLVD